MKPELYLPPWQLTLLQQWSMEGYRKSYVAALQPKLIPVDLYWGGSPRSHQFSHKVTAEDLKKIKQPVILPAKRVYSGTAKNCN